LPCIRVRDGPDRDREDVRRRPVEDNGGAGPGEADAREGREHTDEDAVECAEAARQRRDAGHAGDGDGNHHDRERHEVAQRQQGQPQRRHQPDPPERRERERLRQPRPVVGDPADGEEERPDAAAEDLLVRQVAVREHPVDGPQQRRQQVDDRALDAPAEPPDDVPERRDDEGEPDDGSGCERQPPPEGQPGGEVR
jgi:hypothetical protein